MATLNQNRNAELLSSEQSMEPVADNHLSAPGVAAGDYVSISASSSDGQRHTRQRCTETYGLEKYGRFTIVRVRTICT